MKLIPKTLHNNNAAGILPVEFGLPSCKTGIKSGTSRLESLTEINVFCVTREESSYFL